MHFIHVNLHLFFYSEYKKKKNKKEKASYWQLN